MLQIPALAAAVGPVHGLLAGAHADKTSDILDVLLKTAVCVFHKAASQGGSQDLVVDASISIGAVLPLHQMLSGSPGGCIESLMGFLNEQFGRLQSPSLSAEGCLAAFSLIRQCCKPQETAATGQQEEDLHDDLVVTLIENALMHPDFTVQQVKRLVLYSR